MNNLQSVLGGTLTELANSSLQLMKPFMEGMMNNMTTISQSVQNVNIGKLPIPGLFKETCNCCPPEQECPPGCITTINRTAAEGERILVPVLVKNTCSQVKTYRIGVRELKDQYGQPAPVQPNVNKQSLTLDPGRSETVIMVIDLEKFQNGSTYRTEIVIREKDINQNVCFTLKINNDHNLATAEPQDERKYTLRWQSWQSHYYCEPARKQRGTPSITN